MAAFTVSRLAREAGVKPSTIRYYERRRLLPMPRRTLAGYRVYTDDALRRLGFIKHAQGLGFSLREVQELLGLLAKKRSSAQVCAVTREKIQVIEEKIGQLRRFKENLELLTSSCEGKGPADECVIMKHLFA